MNDASKKAEAILRQALEISSPERREVFLAEACGNDSVLNHPHVCVIHEVGETEDQRPFIAMEYLEGQTLAAWMSRKPLRLEEVIQFGIQIADALEAAHDKGIVHRDIKPANIWINERSEVKVLDFGIAKRLTPESTADADSTTEIQTRAGQVLGTPGYMSPEQVRGEDLDKRTDIWSYGCVLFECLTGNKVFEGGSSTELIGAVLHKEPDVDSTFAGRQ